MAEVLLTIAQIKACVLKLVENAKVKIPEFPKETWNVEHHYVSELFKKKASNTSLPLNAIQPSKMKT